MDELSAALNNILTSEEGMKKISEIASALGLGSETGDSTKNKSEETPAAENKLFDNVDIGKIVGIFSKLNKEDKNIVLLNALKPHLKDGKKVEEAIKLLKIMNLLPELKDSGILEGILR